jgi:hypothetical protein
MTPAPRPGELGSDKKGDGLIERDDDDLGISFFLHFSLGRTDDI